MTEQPLEILLCPLKHTLNIVGGKWKLPIICLLAGEKPLRYSVIKRKINGITNMMLAQSLKELEEQGIVHREQYPEIPPRVEYHLTADGQSLLPALQMLAQWGEGQMQRSGCGLAACEICQAQTPAPVEAAGQ